MKRLLSSFVLWVIILKLSAQEINFQHIEAKNGLAQISVLSIYQDEHGYMWFGTREGLNRFDGQDFDVYQANEKDKYSIPSNIVNIVCGDQKGMMYVLCGYKHLVSYDKRKDKFELINDECQTISSGKNQLWYATNNTIIKYDYDTKSSVDYFRVQDDFPIIKLYESSNAKLYVGTEKGLAVLDDNKVFNILIPNNHITAIYEDSKKNIWVGTADNGVYKIKRTGLIEHYTSKDKTNSLSSNIIRDFCEDNFGQIWIATFSGLDKMIPESGEIMNFKSSSNKPNDLSHTSIYSLFKDRQGTLWIGTYYGGVNFYNPEANIYTYFFPNPLNTNTINFPIVGKMTEDGEGNLWICTEGGGLNFYNRKEKKFSFFKAGRENSISHNNLKCIWYNPENDKLYIGTHMGGLNIYDIQTRKFTHINTQNTPLLPNNVIQALSPYKDKLLVLTQKGIVELDLKTGGIVPFLKDKKISDEIGIQITTMTVDSKNNLWLAQTDGGLKKYQIETKKLSTYLHSFDQPGSIGRYNITRIFETKKDKLLFSTLGSGLYEYLEDKDIFVRYSSAEAGLLSDFIYDISETSNGYLVLLTNKGINLFNPKTGKNQFLDKDRGLPLDMINVDCGIYATQDGEVFAGGFNGMTSFYENQITPVQKDYNLFFSELFLESELIRPKAKNGILKSALPYQESIRLKHNQNNFSVKFAVSNYIKANKTSYEYKLTGLDDKWIPTTEQTIKYSNLSPGSYVLHVREAKGNSPSSKSHEIKLLIKVTPPYYASILAYVIYFLLVAFILWRIIVFNKSKILLTTSLEFEKRENDRIKELNQTKLQFFTNISHEFRTPLTLIIGHIESMAQMGSISPVIHNKLVKVYKNATHLRNLITELLDFRKQEKDLLSLKVANHDIVSFAQNIYLSFNEMAANRKINYTFFSVERSIMLWFDAVQLQKVLYNLISNAFKYSKDNSTISIKIERKNEGVSVCVTDSGIGIHENDLEKIFERFYQSKEQVGNSGTTFSTGVGLALSKGIVELHHGEIKAIRNKDAGATFCVTLLSGSDHFTAEEKTPEEEMNLNSMVDTELPDRLFLETINIKNEEEKNQNSTILIVEDNEEMLQFLSEIFSSIYNVETATDGLEAIEKIQHIQPDIVLSDIMMPNMTGKELCAKLKTNFDTSHIPVVLLTADSSEEQNIEGLMMGADDYITKPFNVKALISRCNNLVTSRKLMQEKFSKQVSEVRTSLATNKIDQELLNKATQIVMDNIDNSEFDVNTFASEMALGRSKLYIKLKGITGMTPNDFIMNIRLKTAATLLINENELNISDITYRLGFSTPRYFSKCFKALFGISPLNYRRANNPSFANQEEEEDEAEDK